MRRKKEKMLFQWIFSLCEGGIPTPALNKGVAMNSNKDKIPTNIVGCLLLLLFSTDDDDDELMLNVLRCHLTY